MSNSEDVKKLYVEVDCVRPQNDRWHKYIHNKTTKIVKRWTKSSSKSLILNAGSGGTSYKINGEIYHVDLCEKMTNQISHYWVRNIVPLPYVESGIYKSMIWSAILSSFSKCETIKMLRFSRWMQSIKYSIEFESK